MSTVAFNTSSSFELGDLVCIDPITSKAVPYDSELKCIGAAFRLVDPSLSPNGRQWYAINGPPYYERDEFVYGENLLSDFSTTNSSASLFNPLTDVDVVTVITSGFAPLKKGQTIPDSWVLIKTGETLDWYIIR